MPLYTFFHLKGSLRFAGEIFAHAKYIGGSWLSVPLSLGPGPDLTPSVREDRHTG